MGEAFVDQEGGDRYQAVTRVVELFIGGVAEPARTRRREVGGALVDPGGLNERGLNLRLGFESMSGLTVAVRVGRLHRFRA